MLYRKNRYFEDTFTYSGSTLLILKKQKTLQLLFVIENTHNKQTIKEKDSGKNKKGIDSEVNKVVSCRKKWEKMFHVQHKADMCMCYAKQKINLAYS